MGKSIKDILSSYRTSIVLLLIYATALALATVIEKYGGTPVAKAFVYYSPALFLLYGLIMVNFFATSVRHNLFKSRKWGFLVTHLSFVVILAGALVTHLFGQEGIVHLREGESTGSMLVQTNRGTSMHQLPFSLELVKFTLERYPGSSSPSSFESDLIIHVDGEVHKEKISMNNVIDIKGYRLFQASYDKNERGSILSVNKDVAGRSITYTGYVLLFAGLILCFTGKNTRFRVLAKQLLSVGCVLLFMLPVNTHARPPEPSPAHTQISREHAKSFGSLPMQSVRGRIQPVNTFSSEVLRKLHKSGKINGLNPDQFLLSVLCLPEMWMQTPLISCDNKSITYNHDLADGYCFYNEMFDSNGRYKLEAELTEAFAKSPASRTGYEKDLIKLDEQVNIVHLLFGWGLINLFPVKGDEQHTWYAPGDNFPENAQVAAAEIREIMNDYRYAVVEATQSHNWQQADKELQRIRDWQNSNNTLSDVSPGRIKAELAYNNVNIFAVSVGKYT